MSFPRHSRRPRYAVYLLLVLAPALLLMLAAPLMVCLPSYGRGGTNPWVQILDYPYTLRGQTAGIVVVGDSSALFGVDPQLLGRELGGHALNLSGSINSLGLTGTLPLRAYLQNNAAPALLVIYLAPWNTGHAPPDAWPYGVISMLRQRQWKQLWASARHDPIGMLESDIIVMKIVLLHLAQPGANMQTAQTIAAQGGHIMDPFHYPAMRGGCTLHYHAPADAGTLPRDLAAAAPAGTRVLLYLAPIPGCGNSAEFTTPQFLGGLHQPDTAAPVVLPPPTFAEDPEQVHVLPENVPAATDLLAQAITRSGAYAGK